MGNAINSIGIAYPQKFKGDNMEAFKSNYEMIQALAEQVDQLQNQVNDLIITVNHLNKKIIEGDQDV